jgi:hypothetical protein
MSITPPGFDVDQSRHQKNPRHTIEAGVDQRQELQGMVQRMPLRRLTERMT